MWKSNQSWKINHIANTDSELSDQCLNLNLIGEVKAPCISRTLILSMITKLEEELKFIEHY